MDERKEKQPSTGTAYAKTGTLAPTGATKGPEFVVYGAEKKSPDQEQPATEPQLHDNKSTLFAKTGTSQAATDAAAHEHEHEQETSIVYGKKPQDAASEEESKHWWDSLIGKP